MPEATPEQQNQKQQQQPPVRVAVRIESRSGGQHIVQQAIGDWYDKGGRIFIRYPETAAEYGRTITTVKLEPDSVKILRQGDVRSDQSFIAGERRIGYYENAQGRLELAVLTRTASHPFDGILFGNAASPIQGTIELYYDLEVAGEPAGTYIVKLTIQEEPST